MRNKILGMAVCLAACAAVCAAEKSVVVCPVDGMIDDGVGVLVKRAVFEAKDASALVLVIDTPGGLLDSAIEITKTLTDAPCPTIAYIKGMGAISAGALISYACQQIIMAPESNIGAATPVIMSPEGMQPTSEKEVSYMRAKMRALAERNHHNPAIAEAMVDKDIELRSYTDLAGQLYIFSLPARPEGDEDSKQSIGDAILKSLTTSSPQTIPQPANANNSFPSPTLVTLPALPPGISLDQTQVVLERGKLLTLTPQEALRWGLIPATAESLEDVLEYCKLENARVIEIIPTWSEQLFRFLVNPMVSGLLLLLGIGGLYLEFKAPGFGAFGIAGIVCLALFFGAHYVIGLADWIDVLLVFVGLGLIALEALVIPGFGLAGMSGICCLIVGLYLSLTRVTIPEYSWEYDRLHNAGTLLATTFVSALIFAYLVWRYLPRTPFLGWIVQSHAQHADQGYVVQTTKAVAEALGQEGVAVSVLRPVGRGRFGEKTYPVVTRGEYLQAGTPIAIIAVDGNRYVVEERRGPKQAN